MSDPILNLTDPTHWFPRLRKVIAAIVRPAMRQPQKAYQQAEHKLPSSIMAWCAGNFDGAKAIFHFLRIERRIHPNHLSLKQRFELSEPHECRTHLPGYYLWHGFRRRRP